MSKAKSKAAAVSDRLERKKRFIRALAEFLEGDAARLSIGLELGKIESQRWRTLRSATPLFGWLTVDEAEQQLAEFLG